MNWATLCCDGSSRSQMFSKLTSGLQSINVGNRAVENILN